MATDYSVICKLGGFVNSNPELISADFDGSGVVDSSDLLNWQQDFSMAPDALIENGDANRDGDVDGSDLAVFAADFGRTDCLECIWTP